MPRWANISGIGAQANMVAGGDGIGQPARVKASTRQSRRRLIDGANLVDAVLRAVQRRGGRHLDRREGAVVEIGLDAGQRLDQPLIADGEADAPAGHGVGLGQRGELDRDVDGARDLQDRGRRLAVEIDLGIGEIGQHEQVVLLGEARRPPGRSRDRRPRAVGIGGIVEHQRRRLRHRMAHRLVERGHELANRCAPADAG